ncbi:hypothetical protein [Streptomyces sp. DH24]|uniref:hypothetical protein n=1 Tax=Streptomyces sp. DH24 TaxID=3040123 RepID=UPI002441FC4A|nr:hypothetical protein [Streptomyces sp. DH24]MDG9720809.1 hypothetical protein [Streptomyces sp. DH24]
METLQDSIPCTPGTPSAPSAPSAPSTPTTAGRAPAGGGGAPPPGGAACDVVTVPARQGLEAVDILRRAASDAVGPVLHDGGGTLGFLVPSGTAEAWDVPGSTCTQTNGRGLSPAPEPPAAADSGWLLPPGEADPATDPAMLRAALGEAARLIEAADSCR